MPHIDTWLSGMTTMPCGHLSRCWSIHSAHTQGHPTSWACQATPQAHGRAASHRCVAGAGPGTVNAMAWGHLSWCAWVTWTTIIQATQMPGTQQVWEPCALCPCMQEVETTLGTSTPSVPGTEARYTVECGCFALGSQMPLQGEEHWCCPSCR